MVDVELVGQHARERGELRVQPRVLRHVLRQHAEDLHRRRGGAAVRRARMRVGRVAAGRSVQAAGGRRQAAGYRLQTTGCRLQAAGLRVERGHQSVLEQLARAPEDRFAAAVVAVDLLGVRRTVWVGAKEG